MDELISFFLMLQILVVGGVAPYHDPHCGGKQVIVHLFEWKWTDIAKECERFLGPKGYCGVQVSPPMEHAMITTDGDRPWWERYQPISYKLTSRSGNEEQLKDMVQRCKAVGVRVYVDAVVNHMAGLGRKGVGTAGSTFDSDARDFPGVPFTKDNFNDRSDCPSGDGNVNNYGDPKNVRNCYLVGLTDLDASQEYVQDKISGYFNHLISLGVAGFRVDAAKHMWPKDLEGILAKTHDLPEGGRPFFYHEVIDRNDGAIKVNEYFHLGYVTEFRYMQKVREGASGDLGRLGAVYDPGWGMAPPDQAFVFVDNHDTQRGNEALTYKHGAEYKRAVAFTLAYNYGFTRVMSSYYFTDNSAGPPRNADMSAKDVIIKADGTCDNGWVCEHRWKSIGNMAMFRNAVAGTSVDNFKYENGVLSFNRGNKGFFAMGSNPFSISVNTGLPAGEYCDLISECAQKIRVDGSGHAQVSPKDPTDPFVAIITQGGENIVVPIIPDQGVDHSGDTTVQTQTQTSQDNVQITVPITTAKPYVPTGQEDFQRTVIIIERQTNPGQDLFIRGGVDYARRPGCSASLPATSNPCAIPIKHINLGTTSHFDKVTAWSAGDNFLDWSGPESSQGSYQGRAAEGTPAVWSTNDKSNSGYNDLNTYGPHYWIIDLEMDCSRTEDSFFELKAIVNGGWENDLGVTPACTGLGSQSPSFSSKNHIARCGYKNVFHFNNPACEITPL
ncbi:alpha-amylase-like [Biomphalaria glabrata]|uniref:Alpha-amylase n=1 Tax=Biomphalaria glabrata TaxID=6526 RepID=A0A9W3B322_BIOGL|nr:alpha-amylase-like [Biomphalaria glabrata]